MAADAVYLKSNWCDCGVGNDQSIGQVAFLVWGYCIEFPEMSGDVNWQSEVSHHLTSSLF